MRNRAILFSFLLLFCFVAPSLAQESAKPENIVGKMAYKFTSGITNVATSVIEIPKQCYLTIRDQGAVGFVIGPPKGLGMTIYRTFIGAMETTLFLVPPPGYYDPMIDPEFVWNGWEGLRSDSERAVEVRTPEPMAGAKGE
jgi:putative exosortase-associated protein (TIGR04073 family)